MTAFWRVVADRRVGLFAQALAPLAHAALGARPPLLRLPRRWRAAAAGDWRWAVAARLARRDRCVGGRCSATRPSLAAGADWAPMAVRTVRAVVAAWVGQRGAPPPAVASRCLAAPCQRHHWSAASSE